MSQLLIDTHAHIYLEQFRSDFDMMLSRARDAGVAAIVMPAIDLASVEKAVRLCNQYTGLYAMAAIHPSETKEATDTEFDSIRAWCDESCVVAVGESGLDYYWDRSFDDRQKDFLRRHIALAVEVDLPLILHNREAANDLISILKNETRAHLESSRLRGIFHCFGGPVSVIEAAYELDFLLGIGGTLTFKNSGVADLIRNVSLERIVLETDAPFLAPVPYRGKRNEPSYVRLVAQKLAEIKDQPVDEVMRITTENAMRLFSIDLPDNKRL